MMRNYLFSLILCFVCIVKNESCDLPTEWQNKDWWNLRYGTTPSRAANWRPVSFGTSTVSGMAVTVHGTLIDSWTCYLKQDNIVVLKGDAIADAAGDDIYTYVAMEIGNSRDEVVIYYSRNNVESNAFDERVYTALTSESVTLDDVLQLNSRPTDGEYNVLLPTDLEENFWTEPACAPTEPPVTDCNQAIDNCEVTMRAVCCGQNKCRRQPWKNVVKFIC